MHFLNESFATVEIIVGNDVVEGILSGKVTKIKSITVNHVL